MHANSTDVFYDLKWPLLAGWDSGHAILHEKQSTRFILFWLWGQGRMRRVCTIIGIMEKSANYGWKAEVVSNLVKWKNSLCVCLTLKSSQVGGQSLFLFENFSWLWYAVMVKNKSNSLKRYIFYILNTRDIKRMLFNWTKQDKTCKFLRKSSFSSYVQQKNKKNKQFSLSGVS